LRSINARHETSLDAAASLELGPSLAVAIDAPDVY